jgi:hypothetical protein
VEISLVGENPYVSGFGTHHYIRTRLIVKADNAAHIPSIRKLSPIAKEVRAIVHNELIEVGEQA